MKKEKETKENEKKPLMVDFGKVSVQMTFEGEPEKINYRHSLGNAIRQASGDIALDEFARKVYFSKGEVEVPLDYIPFILQVVKDKYNIPTQEAFNKLLTLKN